jgi:hypothetical protein
MMHIVVGQEDFDPAKNKFHGGEQVIDDKDEIYIWEKRENVCYDIR